jgi:alpha-tubulin suppressor-like RCC1 family protein
VSAWTGSTAVTWGAYHTVGLRSDGTVVATGRNGEGQCDVSSWAGVKAVACSDYNTLAVLADGTVVSTGYQPFSELSGWKDVTSLSAGSYGAVAISADGRVYCSHPSLRSENLADAVAADVSTGYCAALKEDGTVVHTAVDLNWENVVALSASATGTLAIAEDGRILCHWFRSRDALDFSDIPAAVALSAGATHTAVLLADGTVVTRGLDDQGQCATAAWDLGETSLD